MLKPKPKPKPKPHLNTNKKKCSSVTSKDFGEIVVQVLKSNEYDYRTAEGIAKDLKVQINRVKKVLNSDSRVRVSVMESNDGKKLYALKNKKSALGDYMSAFRALSSDKMGIK